MRVRQSARFAATLAHGAIGAALVVAAIGVTAFEFTSGAQAQIRLFGLGETRDIFQPQRVRVEARTRTRVKTPAASSASNPLSDLPDAA